MKWRRLSEEGPGSSAGMAGVKARLRIVQVKSVHGSFKAPVDGNGALVCPVCGAARFYSVKDLVYHIAYHARNRSLGKP
ncbi:hypothetical protein [Stetteria hydrogenophila]